MVEVVAAAFLPPGLLLVIAQWRRFGDDFRRSVVRWFIPLALIWWAPCWLTGSSPAPFDFLFSRVAPWSALARPSFPPGNLLLSDVPMQFVPWRHLVVDAYRHGELPFLNRFAGSGSPLWENPQAAVLYPLTILGIPFSSFAWPLFAAMCKTLLALTGTFLFLRAEDVGERGAIFGAIAYGFSSFGTAYALFPQTNVTVLLPWLLLAISRLHLTGAAIAVALMLAGGHPESMVHCAMIGLPYGVRVALKGAAEQRSRRFRTLALAAICGTLLAAPVVIPFATYLSKGERFTRVVSEPGLAEAPRATLSNMEGFVLPAHFWASRTTESADNFNEVATGYAGLASLALFLSAALTDARRQRFWLLLFLLLLPLAFHFAPVSALLSRLPLLGSMLHGRIRFALAFVIAVVAARQVDSSSAIAVTRTVAASMAALVLMAVIVQWPVHVAEGTSSVVLASATAAILTTLLLAVPRLGGWMPLMVFADLAALGMAYHAPVSRELFYPATPGLAAATPVGAGPFRTLGIESAMAPNSGAMLGSENIGVHDPMSFEAYCALLSQGGYDRHGYFNRFHRLPPAVLLNFLGVRYVITPPGALSTAWPVVYRGSDANVILNPMAMPRWFVPLAVDRGSLQTDGDARRVHVDNPSAVRLGPAAIKVERYGRNDDALLVSARSESFVATSEVALPGWRLERNGEPWPLVRVNQLFEGWTVPAGTSHFVLRYVPAGLGAGVGCAVLGGLLLVVFALADRRAAS